MTEVQTPRVSTEKAGGNGTSGAVPPSRNRLMRPLPMTIITLAVVVGLIFVVHYAIYASSHVSTDNASLTSDIVQIAPQVSGTVMKVLVSENQVVKQGDLLAVLDDRTYKAAVAQAQANLDAAVAQAKGAGLSVQLTAETGGAQELQAQGVLEQAQSGIGAAQADELRSQAAVANSAAAARVSEANVQTAQAALEAAMANRNRAGDAVKSAQALLESAKAGVRAAQAVYDKAAHDADRAATLVSKGAVSAQSAEAASSGALTAKAQLENAQALVVQKEADLSAARQQQDAANAGILQAKAQISAAKEQAGAARIGIRQAQALHQVAQQSVLQAQARRQQALGQVTQANTSPRQVAISQSSQAQATARIEQARAALDAARLQLSYTHIYAPSAGRVSKKTVEVGALVQPGTPLMAIVTDAQPWVVANFKETQLASVKPGMPAQVSVDALPGDTFHGRVDSVSAATGAMFALLPADNATGNFTKVVQRIPVKIVLDAGQKDADRLRAGMSVVASIKTK